VASVALGACIIEKHLTLSRGVPGPDSPFSLEPAEFRAMVDAVRLATSALGQVSFGPASHETASLGFRRSLFVVADIKAGETITMQNVRSIRPAGGLPPKHLPQVLGQIARQDIARGTPLEWSHLQKQSEPSQRAA
jgi:N-acetylneuraminate synthase